MATTSADIYRDKRAIIPTPDFTPTLTNTPSPRFTVPADKWANAVAFEVYNSKGRLIRICLRGLNHKDNATTDVLLPPDAARVTAVAWNGLRHIIYSTRGDSINATPDTIPNAPGTSKRK